MRQPARFARSDVSVVAEATSAMQVIATIATPLRRAGISVQTFLNPGKVRSQLRHADGAWIVIAEGGSLRLRNVANGCTRPGTAAEIVEGLTDWFTDDYSDPTPLIDALLAARAEIAS